MPLKACAHIVERPGKRVACVCNSRKSCNTALNLGHGRDCSSGEIHSTFQFFSSLLGGGMYRTAASTEEGVSEKKKKRVRLYMIPWDLSGIRRTGTRVGGEAGYSFGAFLSHS